MNKVKILTDSCSDLAKDLREKYDIDYVMMRTVYKGVESKANLDWVERSPKEFYDIMRNGERVTTTQVPPEDFEIAFKKYLDEGYDIVYIGCSLKLSSSVNTGAVVAKQLKETDYPNANIYCVDSLIACMGEGVLAIEAAKLRDEGLDAAAIVEKVTAMRNTVNMFCTVNSLDALKRAGRIKASKAFFGNLMGVKPILISAADGNNIAIKKAKGRQTSLKEIVNLLKEAMDDPSDKTVYIAHADCEEDAQVLKQLIEQEIKPKETYIGIIGPIIGASIGPEAVAIYGIGKEVTVTG